MDDPKFRKPGSMEAWKHGKPGSVEAWKHGSMEAWKHGSKKAWKHVDMGSHGITSLQMESCHNFCLPDQIDCSNSGI